MLGASWKVEPIFMKVKSNHFPETIVLSLVALYQ